MEAEFIGFDPAVLDELAKGRHSREVLESIKLKREQAQFTVSPVGDHRAMEGLGRMKMSIPPLSYHYWGRRLGYQCWSDPQFLREFERDNPSVRVKQAGGTRPQIQSGWEGSKRFSKVYA